MAWSLICRSSGRRSVARKASPWRRHICARFGELVNQAQLKQAPYGSWKSPITSDLIVAKSIGLSEIRFDGGDIYWLESRPEEGGRNVVVRGISAEDFNPRPFNARTRCHEYGGGAWRVADGTLYFSNYADQRLYRLERYGAKPVPVTPEGAWRFADGIIDSRHKRWIGVREDHTAAG